MSSVSGASSGSSNSGQQGRVFGVPNKCWCGQNTSTLTSRSDHNPYRRYYRCAYAAEHRLKNDNHVFKWVDEALLNEIGTLKLRVEKLEQELRENRSESMNSEKIVFEKVQMKIEKEVVERVEAKMRKMMIVVLVGGMIIGGGCIKLFG